MEEKPSGGKITLRILSTGCGCGLVGAIGMAALIGLSASPKKQGAGYEWIGLFIVGGFVFGGVICGIIGALSATFLNLRKSKGEISWPICIMASILTLALLYYVLPSFPHQLKDYNIKTSRGKESLFWLIIIMTFSLFPLLYCASRLIRGNRRPK